MSTTITDTTAYAQPSDFLLRYDARDVVQWVSDQTAPVSQASLSTNPNLFAALTDASGMIESALLAAGRYTVQDLQTLLTVNAGTTTTTIGNSASFLIRLTCDLALGLLIERRPYLERDMPQSYQRALDWLDRLRKGERVFAFQQVVNAGNPMVTFQSQADLAARNLASYQAGRYFGFDRAEEFVPSGTGTGGTVVP